MDLDPALVPSSMTTASGRRLFTESKAAQAMIA